MVQTPQLAAGDPITGAYRTRLPLLGVTASEVALVSSTVATDIPGLAVQLDAGQRYAIDGYIGYIAPSAADIKFTFTAPPGATGHWFLGGQDTAETSGIGAMEFILRTDFGSGGLSEAGAAGSGDMACTPFGYIITSGLPGPMQWQYAQAVSDVNRAVIIAGSWIRATRMYWE